MSIVISRFRSAIQASMERPLRLERNGLLKLALVLVLSFFSYLFFSRLVVTAVEVQGCSMSPTLVSGDVVMLNRFAFLHREPHRGELVVLRDPETSGLVVKRIVGMPGEKIQVDLGQAKIDGKPLVEPYVLNAAKAMMLKGGKATTVPQGCYFVLGDNRNNSVDSRAYGPVPRQNILGVINL